MIVSTVIKALQEQFPNDQLVVGGTEDFGTLNNSYLSLQSDLKPAAIFLPRNAEDVSNAGQQPAPGVSNIANGITLDLRHLTGIDLKNETVSLGAGERSGPIYEQLTEYGLGVTGSRSALGGIGGLALAGMGDFSRRSPTHQTHAHVIGFQVGYRFSHHEKALSATMLSTIKLSCPLAILSMLILMRIPIYGERCGAEEITLGIVTRFDIRTFPQGPFWGGAVFYFPPSFPSQIQAYCDELNKSDPSKETHIMISQGYSVASAELGGHLCMNQLYYTKEVEKPAVLEPFANIQPQLDPLNSMRMLTLKDTGKEQACAYMNTTVKADAATLTTASDLFTAAFQPLKSLEGITCSFTLQAYPVSLLEKCDNSLGLNPKTGPLMSILLVLWWPNEADDNIIINTFRSVLEKIDEDASSRGTAVPYKYVNYAYTFQDPISSYGIGIHENLRHVGEKHDPEGLFQKGVPGGFKLD